MPLSPSLTDNAARESLIARLRSLRPDSPRQWGKMNVQQMMWHVSQAYQSALGDISVPNQSNWFFRNIVKPFAFYAPFEWPKNGPTMPQFNAVKRAPVVDTAFAQQVEELVALIDRFSSHRDRWHPHAAFGPLSHEEWMHWGWRHTDHHLRQFSV